MIAVAISGVNRCPGREGGPGVWAVAAARAALSDAGVTGSAVDGFVGCGVSAVEPVDAGAAGNPEVAVVGLGDPTVAGCALLVR